MELIPTVIVVMLGAVMGVGALLAGTRRAPVGAHVAGSARRVDREDSWSAPSRVSADS